MTRTQCQVSVLFQGFSGEEKKIKNHVRKANTEQQGRMIKGPPLISQTYIFSVLYCNCQTCDDIFGQIFQNSRFATLGAYYMFKK